jgi:ureidoglycolate hydrolase
VTEVVVTVPTRSLDPQAFAPFGTVLEARGSLRPWVGSGELSVERVHLPAGMIGPEVDELARHDSYDQVFIETAGRLALVVALAPTEEGERLVDYDHLGAFVLEPGDAALVRRGIWHITVPLTDVTFINLTRRDLDEEPTRTEAGRPYIANVNMKDADGRVLLVQEQAA